MRCGLALPSATAPRILSPRSRKLEPPSSGTTWGSGVSSMAGHLARPALPNHVGTASEFLRERHQKGPALAELRGAYADARAVADLVLVVEQVDDVETDLRALADADRD